MKYSNSDLQEASRRRAEQTGELDSIEESRPVLDNVQEEIWLVYQYLHRGRFTGMGPSPISAESIYNLCGEMSFNPEEFIGPVIRLDDLWLEWYRQEEENKGTLQNG